MSMASSEGASCSSLVFSTSHGHSSGKLILCSITQATASSSSVKPAKLPAASSAGSTNASSSKPSGSSSSSEKTLTDVICGALARAGSQGTIHPLDTLKVRLQAKSAGASNSSGTSQSFRVNAASSVQGSGFSLSNIVTEIGLLYRGVVGAALGAGVIIGAYFAFYSTTKQLLKNKTKLPDGSVAFISGATAAVGSSFIKVPIAVCIRSVQAGVYKNFFHAGHSIVQAVGLRGLFTGFLPTLLEDAPDMAVKFAVYESLRAVLTRLRNGRKPSPQEDLLIGGLAGAAAAAATTPLDLIKTRMMCSAAVRPSFIQGVQSILAERQGLGAFFRGMGPRALSNGLNSAVFFCFFEALRRVLVAKQAATAAAAAAALNTEGAAPSCQQHQIVGGQQQQRQQQALAIVHEQPQSQVRPAVRKLPQRSGQGQAVAASTGRLACLSLALPLRGPAVWL